MLEIFLKGGPVMWPLLVTSIVAFTVVFERLYFVLAERARRDDSAVGAIFAQAELGHLEEAIRIGRHSGDPIARVLTFALVHRETSPLNALHRAANCELQRYERGLSVLDTVITLAPLLGLLGTVTGMIRAFSLLGNQELGAPTAITGGIAEALFATAFGLLIAIVALLPFNFLNRWMERARHEIEDAAARLDSILSRPAAVAP